MHNLLSIITVNYNNKLGLNKTIQSLMNQSNVNYEYIIIDGGSTDGSLEIIEKNKNLINYAVSEKDGGIYDAMNKGIKYATGKYCLFLNAGDSLFDANTIENLYNEIINGDEEIIFGSIYMEDANKPFIKHFHDFSLYMASYSPMPHQSTIIQTKLLKTLKGYDVNFKILADRVFFIEAYLNNARFKRLNLCITRYDMTGISSTNIVLFKQEEFKIRTEKFKFLQKEFEFYEDYHYYKNSKLFDFVKFFKIKYNKFLGS